MEVRNMDLRLATKDNSLCFSRGNKISAENEKVTCRELFSAFGSLVGHYPKAEY